MLRVPVLGDGRLVRLSSSRTRYALNGRQGTTDAPMRADGIMFDIQRNLYVCAKYPKLVLIPSRVCHTPLAGLRRGVHR